MEESPEPHALNDTGGSVWHQRALLRAVRQRNWKAACRHVLGLRGPDVGAAVLGAAVNAAIMARDPPALRRAASLAAGAVLPPAARVSLATRLAGASEPLLALAVLVADPDVFRRDGIVMQDGSMIGGTLRNVGRQLGALEPALQSGLLILAKRLLNETTQETLPSDHAFRATAVALAPPRGTVRILRAPGLATDRVTEMQAVLAKADRAIAAGMEPGVRVYRDVFVNNRTQIWRPDGQALQTFNAPIPPASLKAMDRARRVPRAAMGLTSHDNTYHWLGEVLPSLAWCLDADEVPMPILMREAAAPFERASLSLAARTPPQVIDVAHAVHVGELHMGSRTLAQLARHEFFAASFARIVTSACAQAPDGTGSLIYVSRADSRRRVLTNERALEAALAARGFAVLELSKMPFAAQVAAFARARMVVAPHGAGLAHLLYARPGTTVLEMVPALPGMSQLRSCFARISGVCGHDHHMWLDMPAEPTDMSGWTLDLDAFLPVVDDLLAKLRP